jgi:hypothetical protein
MKKETQEDKNKKENYLYLSLYVILGILIVSVFSSNIQNTILKLERKSPLQQNTSLLNITKRFESLNTANTDNTMDYFRIVRNRLIRERLKPDRSKLEEIFNTIDVFDGRRTNLFKRRNFLLRRLKNLKKDNLRRQTIESLVTEIASLEAELSKLEAEELKALGKLLSPEEELQYLKIKKDALSLTEIDKAYEQ